jgi:hypothetical protein
MSNDNTNDDYKGPGRWESMVGRSYVEQNIAGNIAAITGAGVGAVAGKSVGEKVMAKAAKGVRHIGEKINAKAVETFPDAYIEKAVSGHKFNANVTHEVEELATAIEKIHPRVAGAAVFAIGAAIAVGTIAAYHGMYKGYKSAKEGKEQFEALKVNANILKGRAEIAAAANMGTAAPAVG